MEGLGTTLKKFLPFLEELRKKLMLSAIVFSVTFLVGFFSSATVLRHFIGFFNLAGVTIAATSPFQFANIAVDIGFFAGALCALPILTYQVFSFVFPGLTSRERRMVVFSIPLSLILFIMGFLYGFLILYYSFDMMAKINASIGIQNIWDIGQYLSQLFLTSSLLGVLFQFPLVLSALTRLGICTVDILRKKRRLAAFVVFIIVSLLPPTDGVSLLAMSLPLVVLYEATILANRKTKQHVWTWN